MIVNRTSSSSASTSGWSEQQQQRQALRVSRSPGGSASGSSDDELVAGASGLDATTAATTTNTSTTLNNNHIPPPTLCTHMLDSTDVFSEQLSALYISKDFSDITLVIGGSRRTFTSHKFLLSLRSSVFRAMLNGSWREKEHVEVRLEEEDEECVGSFETFLNYLYTGHVELTLQNVKPLYMLANKYDIGSLEVAATNYILHNVATKESNQATIWWQVAQLHTNIHMAERCEKFIIDNFETVSNSTAWFELSPTNLCHLLQQSDIVVHDEYHVYKAAERWLIYHSVGEDQIEDILGHVRFQLIRPEHLMAIEQESALYKTFPDIISRYLHTAYRFQCIHKHIRYDTFMEAYPNCHLRLYTNSEYSYGFSVYEHMATFYTTSSASSADQNRWKWQIVSAPFIRERLSIKQPNITAPSMFALTRQIVNPIMTSCGINLTADDVNILLVTSHKTSTIKYKRVWSITDTANWDKNVVRFRLPEPIVRKLQAKASTPPLVDLHGHQGRPVGAGPPGASRGQAAAMAVGSDMDTEDVNSSDDEQGAGAGPHTGSCTGGSAAGGSGTTGTTATVSLSHQHHNKMKKCQFRLLLIPKEP